MNTNWIYWSSWAYLNNNLPNGTMSPPVVSTWETQHLWPSIHRIADEKAPSRPWRSKTKKSLDFAEISFANLTWLGNPKENGSFYGHIISWETMGKWWENHCKWWVYSWELIPLPCFLVTYPCDRKDIPSTGECWAFWLRTGSYSTLLRWHIQVLNVRTISNCLIHGSNRLVSPG